MQVVFRLSADLAKQVVSFSRDKGRYEPLAVPQTLDPAHLAMLLPATVALQVLHAGLSTRMCCFGTFSS